MGGRAHTVGDLLALAFVVGAIMMLVRPGSRGPQLVGSVSNAFIASAAGTEGSLHA